MHPVTRRWERRGCRRVAGGRWYRVEMDPGGRGADEFLRRAVAASRLRSLHPAFLERLLTGSRRRRVDAGAVVRQLGERGPHTELVTAGVIRVEVSSPDGRSLTVRYAGPGALLGIASL